MHSFWVGVTFAIAIYNLAKWAAGSGSYEYYNTERHNGTWFFVWLFICLFIA